MDNPRAEKVAVVAEVREKLAGAQAALLADYRGLSVKDMSALRQSLAAAGPPCPVYKNTLVRFAARDLGIQDLEPLLTGPTAITFVDGDAAAAAKALRDFSRTNPLLIVKGGLLGDKVRRRRRRQGAGRPAEPRGPAVPDRRAPPGPAAADGQPPRGHPPLLRLRPDGPDREAGRGAAPPRPTPRDRRRAPTPPPSPSVDDAAPPRPQPTRPPPSAADPRPPRPPRPTTPRRRRERTPTRAAPTPPPTPDAPDTPPRRAEPCPAPPSTTSSTRSPT